MRILSLLLHKHKAWRIIPSQTKRYSIEPFVFPHFSNFIAAGSYTIVDDFNKNYIGIQTTSNGVYQANLGKNWGTQKITNPYIFGD